MTNEVQKIKEEIERRFTICIEQGYTYSAAQLKRVIDFIDSLQEEPVNEDLDEAAEKYAFPEGKDKYGIEEAESNGIYFREEKAKHFKAGAEWQKKRDFPAKDITDSAMYWCGYKDCKEEMMKDAVELHIVESFNPVGTKNEKLHGFIALYYDAEYSDFYPVTRQTIKVIPIKTEQQNEM